MKGNLLRRVLVAKTTVFVGLTMMVAVVLGAASTVQAAPGGNFIIGQVNSALGAVTHLVGFPAGPVLRIDNQSLNLGATALDLRVKPGKAPMTVNSNVKVANLNADLLDGKDSTQYLSADRIYERSNLVAVPAGASNQSILVHCDVGDVALSGGADDIEPPTELNEVSRLLNSPRTWEVEVSRPLTLGGDPLPADPQGVTAEVLCWNLP
jgi:hypothetical protein